MNQKYCTLRIFYTLLNAIIVAIYVHIQKLVSHVRKIVSPFFSEGLSGRGRESFQSSRSSAEMKIYESRAL